MLPATTFGLEWNQGSWFCATVLGIGQTKHCDVLKCVRLILGVRTPCDSHPRVAFHDASVVRHVGGGGNERTVEETFPHRPIVSLSAL